MDQGRRLDLVEAVQKDLDARFPKDCDVPLPEVCEFVGYLILDAVRLAVLDEVYSLSMKRNTWFQRINISHFGFGNTNYQFTVVALPGDSTALGVFIKCVEPGRTNIVTTPVVIRVVAPGPYTEVHIYNEKIFQSRSEHMAEVARIVVDAGYRWLTNFVRRAHDATQDPAADALYSYARTLLPEQVAKNVWLYSVANERGAYTLDSIAYESALATACQRELTVGASPIDLLVEFSTRRVEFERTFTSIALRENATIQRQFARAPYAKWLQIAERAIYGSRGHAIQPLVREADHKLSAGYPPQLRREIEPALRRGVEEIRRIVSSHGVGFRTAMLKVEERNVGSKLEAIAVGISSCAGGFTAEFFKHLH